MILAYDGRGESGCDRYLPAHSRRHLIHADLAHGLAERPLVAERVAHDAVAVTPELVGQRRHHLGAGVDCPLEGGLDVGHLKVDRHRRAAECLRRRRLPVGVLGEVVVEHHHRTVDVEGGMHQPAVGMGHAAVLGGAECLDVEVDGRGGIIDDQTGRQKRLNVDRHGGLLSRGGCASVPTVLARESHRELGIWSQPSTESGLRGPGPT